MMRPPPRPTRSYTIDQVREALTECGSREGKQEVTVKDISSCSNIPLSSFFKLKQAAKKSGALPTSLPTRGRKPMLSPDHELQLAKYCEYEAMMQRCVPTFRLKRLAMQVCLLYMCMCLIINCTHSLSCVI